MFDGWYTAASGGIKVTENFVVAGNITLYAQYIIDASLYIRVGGKESPVFLMCTITGNGAKDMHTQEIKKAGSKD